MASAFAPRPHVNMGAELEEITTEQLGFNAVGGATKLRLLPNPWPVDQLPPPSSSLLSVSSKQGLLAAAGPDAILIATIESVRKSLDKETSTEAKVIDFTPQLTIPAPTRISQVCFTVDGNYLMLSAENGGGLAVYETSSLKQGNKEPTFQIGTENVSVRSIAPNPAYENAHVVAVVLSGGQLMMADLQRKEFVTGVNGSKVIKDAVSCVSWSVKGKQVVAGLGDGTASQLEPTGTVKSTIPRPADIEGDQHVSTIVWLTNDEFLVIHTPSSSDDPDRAPDSTLHLVRTNKERTSFNFSKLPQNPAPPFGMNRSPPTHYISRVRNWHHLLDALVVSSVASPDVGLITKSDAPLSGDIDAERITNVYTATTFAADSSRATLPMSEANMIDTSPIGMAVDFSVTEKAAKPILGDEMEESPFPLPAIMLLNNEGILSVWWFVYNTALRENKVCPSMVAANEPVSSPVPPVSPPQTSGQASPFAAASGTVSGFGGLGKSGQSAFGQPAFGGLGSKPSPWGAASGTQASASAFGKPSFGQSSFGQPAFGQTGFGQSQTSTSGFGTVGGIGQSQSPWAAKPTPSSFSSQTAPAFGQTSFSKFSGATASSSPFGGLASGASPFAQQVKPSAPAFASPSSSGVGSTFGTTPQQSFGSTVTIDSTVGGSTVDSKSISDAAGQTSSVFGKPKLRQQPSRDEDMMDEESEKDESKPQGQKKHEPAASDKPKSGLFGLPAGGFQLGSSFKPASTAVEKDEEPAAAPKMSLFGTDFASSLAKPTDSSQDTETNKEQDSSSTSTPQPAKFFSFPAQPPEQKPDSPAPTTDGQLPEPPLVTSKPIPSPATAHSPATSKSPSADDLGPLAGSSPVEVAVKLPDSPRSTAKEEDIREREGRSDAGDTDDSFEQGRISGEEDEDGGEREEDGEREVGRDDGEADPNYEAEREGDVQYDAGDILPPDPSTVKKPSWFYEQIPGSIDEEKRSFPPTPAKQEPPKVSSPQSVVESPLFNSSTTPVGFPRAPVSFQPKTSTVNQSPRSPSPVRSASTPVLGAFAKEPVAPKFHPRRHETILERTPVYPADLQDTADEDVRRYLEQPVAPDPDIRKLQFQAHQDYVTTVSKEGVPAQIERVYKDVNSMVDTTGLNARYLTNFVTGHEQTYGSEPRDRDGLQDPTDWTLGEFESLSKIESDLDHEVDNYKLTRVDEKIKQLNKMKKELLKMRQELLLFRRSLEEKHDPEIRAAVRSAPLEPLHAAKQQELRTAFATFQKLLAEAEDAALMLRSRIASTAGKTDSKALPTVEAVENTIKKMISMIQQRSSDVDVLEAQMRKLGIATREGTPLRDPDGLRESLRRSVGPDDSFVSSFRNMGIGAHEGGQSEATPGRSSVRQQQTTPQKKPAARGYGVPEEDSDEDDGEDATRPMQPTAEVRRYLEVQARRQRILDVLKQKLLDRAQGIKPEPQD